MVGGGQAGLSVGYHLKRAGVPFVILDASERIGDAWRHRWDSLRLFTPARFDGLDGMSFPAAPFLLPDQGRNGRLSRNLRAKICAAGTAWRARRPRLETRRALSPGRRRAAVRRGQRRRGDGELSSGPIRWCSQPTSTRRFKQLHSIDYRNPGQLRDGAVLIVGAGTPGQKLLLELGALHTGHGWPGHPPGMCRFALMVVLARLGLTRFVFRIVFHRVLSVANPIGP